MKRRLGTLTAGALLGALAAVIVGGIGQFRLWLLANNNLVSTGAPQGLDLWTYFSLARAVWRSPNGITYQYPYELYWPTPAVAFQLPITILAWIGRVTGLPVAFELGRIAGAAASGAAIASLGKLFPRGAWRSWFYVAAALGGGFFILGAIGTGLRIAGFDSFTELHQYVPRAMGRLVWWLPFPVMNLRMPMECIYHGLVLGALACLVKRRYGRAWVLGAMTWASNPFSAVALHGAVLPWLMWRVVESKGAQRWGNARWLLAWTGINIAALAYYGWFLKQWPLFRELDKLYAVQIHDPLEWWRMLLLFFPYGAGLLISVVNKKARRAVWGRTTWRLFAILAVVHLVLLQHTALLGERSMQAFHYNRGYLHLALVVVAWRVLILYLHGQRCLTAYQGAEFWKPWRMAGGGCRRAMIIAASIVMLSCMDNLLFSVFALTRERREGTVERDLAEMVRRIPAKPAPMVVLCDGPPYYFSSYVTAFSPHVSWDAPETMVVPYYAEREQWALEAESGKHGGFAGLGIDYVIVHQQNTDRRKALIAQGWKLEGLSGQMELYRHP